MSHKFYIYTFSWFYKSMFFTLIRSNETWDYLRKIVHIFLKNIDTFKELATECIPFSINLLLNKMVNPHRSRFYLSFRDFIILLP